MKIKTINNKIDKKNEIQKKKIIAWKNGFAREVWKFDKCDGAAERDWNEIEKDEEIRSKKTRVDRSSIKKTAVKNVFEIKINNCHNDKLINIMKKSVDSRDNVGKVKNKRVIIGYKKIIKKFQIFHWKEEKTKCPNQETCVKFVHKLLSTRNIKQNIDHKTGRKLGVG
jgi:hypothetical protein